MLSRWSDQKAKAKAKSKTKTQTKKIQPNTAWPATKGTKQANAAVAELLLNLLTWALQRTHCKLAQFGYYFITVKSSSIAIRQPLLRWTLFGWWLGSACICVFNSLNSTPPNWTLHFVLSNLCTSLLLFSCASQPTFLPYFLHIYTFDVLKWKWFFLYVFYILSF